MIIFRQTDRVIEFTFDESKTNKAGTSLKHQATQQILAKLKSKVGMTQLPNNVQQELILTTQENFNPFLTYDEDYVLTGIEGLVSRYESVSNEKKLVQRKGTSKASNNSHKEKSQKLLSKVKSGIKDTLEQYYELSTETPAASIGGEIQFSLPSKMGLSGKAHPDEIKLRDRLISEYNTPTENGLQDALRSYLVVRSRRLRISLHTALLLSIVYYLFVKRLGKTWLDDLTNYITISSMIPFPTTSALNILNYRFFLVKALDILMGDQTNNCTPKSAYHPARQEFCNNTFRRNEKAARLCAAYLKLYNGDHLRTLSEVSEKLTLYQEQLTVLNKIFKLLVQNHNEEDPSQLSKKQKEASKQLVALISEAKKVQGLSGYFEYELLTVTQFMMLTGGSGPQKVSGSEKAVSQKSECGQSSNRVTKEPTTESSNTFHKEEKCVDSNSSSKNEANFTDKSRKSLEIVPELNEAKECSSKKVEIVDITEFEGLTQMSIEMIDESAEMESHHITDTKKSLTNGEEKTRTEVSAMLEKYTSGVNAKVNKQQEEQRLEVWNNCYSQISNDQVLKEEKTSLQDSILNSAMSNSIELQSLMEGAGHLFKKYPELGDKSTALDKFSAWIKWLLKAEELSENLLGEIEIEFHKLDELHKEALELSIPKHWDLFIQLADHWALAENVLSEYRSKFQIQTESLSSDKNEVIIVSRNRTQNDTKARTKYIPLTSEAKMMKEKLIQTLHFLDCQEYIDELDSKLSSYSTWRTKISSYMKNQGQRVSQAVMNPEATVTDVAQIELKLGELRSEYYQLELREENDEKLLQRLECQLKAYSLMKNLGQPNQTTKEWKKILNFMEESSDVDQKVVNLLKSEISNADKQSLIVKKLKYPTQYQPNDLVTIEDLRSTLDGLQNGLVKNFKDVNLVREIAQRAEILIKKAKEYNASSSKGKVEEYKKILEQFKKLPISLPDEIKTVEEAVNLSTKIAGFTRKYLVLDLKTTENILKQYEKCPIFIQEAEELQSKFTASKTLYEKLKEELNEIVSQQKSLNYSQLEELSDQIDDITYNFEDNLNLFKTQVLVLRLEFFRKTTEFSELQEKGEVTLNHNSNTSTVRITPQALKIFINEGNTLLQTLQREGKQYPALNQAVTWLESVNNQIESQIKEINSIASLEELNKIRSVAGFIDLSQHIIERRLKLLSEAEIVKSIEKPSVSNTEKMKGSGDSTSILQDKSNAIPKTPKFFSYVSNILTKNSTHNEKNETSMMLSKENQPITSRPTSISFSSQTQASDKLFTDSTKISQKVGKLVESSNGVQKLQNILKENLMLSLNDAEALQAAERIMKAFPVLQISKEKFQKFLTHLKRVLKFPNISYFLSQRSLDPKELSALLSQSQSELSHFEDALKTSFITKTKKGQKRDTLFNFPRLDDRSVVKKVKSENNSKTSNLIDQKHSNISQKAQNPSMLEKTIFQLGNPSKTRETELRGYF